VELLLQFQLLLIMDFLVLFKTVLDRINALDSLVERLPAHVQILGYIAGVAEQLV